ncbi:ABC transporter substrate-binding protein [Phyllobacterium sp. 21LDTY02-6]|uniref:ABC transporter substrate-binding protein n=1 Tax=Phyllobacterium sp. 21LDTY02-6 TaxID=2944903 RepID=UPI002020C623|nr:ABC transporter substrate-binding protein [Phyllobacterium sp. 21LDTY02-6]MCO4317917.1 ABC transporter substrate-binding protein [Phyllobacterium sp. 21LDTY02-6]
MALFAPRREVLLGLACALFAPAVIRPTAAAAEDPLRFPHMFGVTELPRPAERVVSLGFSTQDTLLALGVVPVGIRYWFGDQPYGVWPWATPYLKDAKPALIKGTISLEMVATLKPDLIVGVGSAITEAEYAALSRIAPVLMSPPEFPAYGMPWEPLMRLIGRAVGKDQLANELIVKTSRNLAALRQRHPDWAGRTAVAAYHYGGETGIFASADARGRFLKELGFQPTAETARLDKAKSFYQKLSPEDLSALEADLLFWVSSFDQAPDIVNLPMRRTLKAHSEGREVFASGVLAAAISFGSALSLPFAASELEADIAAAIDGDPVTQVQSALRAGLVP